MNAVIQLTGNYSSCNTLGLISISLTALFEDNCKPNDGSQPSTTASRKCDPSENHW